MSAMFCPVCNRHVAKSAEQCPHCGIEYYSKKIDWFWVSALAIVTYFVFALPITIIWLTLG